MPPNDSSDWPQSNLASGPLTLSQVVAFNAQLRNIADAKIPIQLAPNHSGAELRESLATLESRIAIAQSHGISVEQSLSVEATVSEQYRRSLINWVASDGDPESINPLLRNAQWRSSVESEVRFAFVQPLIIIALVYVGYLVMLRSIVPRIEGMYAQIRADGGASLGFLRMLLDTMPYWSIGVPVLLFMFVLLRWYMARAAVGPWLPGYATMVRSVRKANNAELLAQEIENGMGSTRVGSTDRAQSTAHSVQDSVLPSGQEDASIQWALDLGNNTSQRASIVRLLSELHRSRLFKHEQRIGRWLPIVLGCVVSGLFVLVFSVSLFKPMVELLWTVSKP